MKPEFTTDAGAGRFTIANYQRAPVFSNFLPAVAGRWGVPAWAFWLNRGQAVSGMGVGGREGQIIELYSLNKAATRVGMEGFRTFLRLDGVPQEEPFRRGSSAAQSLSHTPSELSVEEIRRGDLEIEVTYHLLPDRPIGGLVRSVTVRDLTGRSRRLELLDGLPRVLPLGLDHHAIKVAPRHAEAMFQAEVDGPTALFRVRQSIADEAEITRVAGGHFAAAFSPDGDPFYVVDPAVAFGDHFDFRTAEGFESGGVAGLRRSKQVMRGRTPTALAGLDAELPADGSVRLVSLVGRADDPRALEAVLDDLGSIEAWDALRNDNRRKVAGLIDGARVESASPAFDAYVAQNFLDNGLRGGIPIEIGGERIYAFVHQNADLERDYHQFRLAPNYLSSDLGHYRNLLQNRRSDDFYFPGIGAHNIGLFAGLIQLDGYNPLEVLPDRFVVADAGAARRWSEEVVGDAELVEQLGVFSLGELAMLVERRAGTPARRSAADLESALSFLSPAEPGGIHAGYWIDHWHYLVDLLESYFTVFPERVAEALLAREHTWFDNPDVVMPRAAKHVMTPRGARRLGAVRRDPEKEELMVGRGEPRHRARTANGEVLRSTLLEKLLVILGTRLATIDPDGLGIEMEADKPGWNDSLNGMPAMFGSGLSETIELRRALRLVAAWVAELDTGSLEVFAELGELLTGLGPLLLRRASGELSSLEYWDQASALKEAYREAIRLGVSGRSGPLPALDELLGDGLGMVDASLSVPAVRDDRGVPHTYFVADAELDPDGGIIAFSPNPVGPFLEGPMHWMREFPEDAPAIYRAVRESPLYDSKLEMYKSSGPMNDADPGLGRAIGAYPPGWLENESIYTHMEYKYLLEVLRSGLVEEFWADARHCFPAFMDPAVYGRSPFEGSSFIVSSAHEDAGQHGRGYQPRLSGMTAEFVSIWLLAALGPRPFVSDLGTLRFEPRPRLPAWLFAEDSGDGGVLSFRCFEGTQIRYRNPKRLDTFGKAGVAPVRFEVLGGPHHGVHPGAALEGAAAVALRAGELDSIDVTLG